MPKVTVSGNGFCSGIIICYSVIKTFRRDIMDNKNMLKKLYTVEKRNTEKWYWGYAIQGLVVLGFAPILIPLIVAQATGPGNIGLIIAALYLGQLVSPTFGKLADKYSRYKTFYIAGYVMLGLGLIGFVTTQSIILWILFAFLQGAGAGTSNTISYSFVVEFHPKKEWDGRLGWLQTFYGTGQAMGLIMASVLGKLPVVGMLICAGLMVPGIILGRMGLPDTSKDKNRAPHFKPETHAVPIKGPARTPFSLIRHYEHLFSSKEKQDKVILKSSFGHYIITWFLVMFGTWLIYNFYHLLMREVFHFDATISSMYYAIAAVIGIFFYAPAGSWAAKYGSRKIVFIGLIMTLVALSGVTALIYVSQTLQTILVPIFFIIMPIAWSPLIVAGTALASELTPVSQGTAMGVYNATTALASVTAAVVGGFVAEKFTYTGVCLLASVMVIISVVSFLPLLKKK